MNRVFRTAAVTTVVAYAFVTVGCGDGTGKVRGKVVANGKPVCWGSVTFMDAKGQYYQGELGLDGSFEIDKCPSGTMKVGVYSPNPEATQTARGGPVGGGAKAGGGGGDDGPRSAFLATQPKKEPGPEKPKPAAGKWFPISEKLTDPTTSGMTVEIKAGQ